MPQLDFLETEETFDWSIEKKIDQAQEVIRALLRKNTPLVLAYSGGKDSSVVASLVLTAAAEAVKEEGLSPLIIVTSSDTLVESPEVTAHVGEELAKMRKFAQKHQFKIQTAVVTPSLLSTWQIKILSGRGLPSYAGTNTDCTVDLKITPQRSYRNKLMAQFDGNLEPVTLLGTRAVDESERRTLGMKLRGENGWTPVRNATGDLVLSPIAMWDVDSVWEYIGYASSGLIESYSDFEETKRIYAHAGGTSCAVVSDALMSGKNKKGGCGARLGCWTCQQANDKSLETMIQFEPRYEYAKGLNQLNKFIRAIRYDWNRRNWVGRTIRGGFIAIEPDTFSPTTVRDIYRYMLQLDFDEEQRAYRAGEKPKFHIMPAEMVVTLDALWSLNGMSEPFAAWYDYEEVYSGRMRYDIPEIEEVTEAPRPATRFLYVGEDWDESAPESEWSGMRDPYYEAMTERACAPDLKELPNGELAWDLPTQQRFEVDPEALALFVDFELERVLDKYRAPRIKGGVTHAYKWYLHYGLISLNHAARADHDSRLRRTEFKDRLGIGFDADIDQLLDMSIPYAQLDESAKQAWAHKANHDQAQNELTFAMESPRVRPRTAF